MMPTEEDLRIIAVLVTKNERMSREEVLWYAGLEDRDDATALKYRVGKLSLRLGWVERKINSIRYLYPPEFEIIPEKEREKYAYSVQQNVKGFSYIRRNSMFGKVQL